MRGAYIERNEEEKPDDGAEVRLRGEKGHPHGVPVELLLVDVRCGGATGVETHVSEDVVAFLLAQKL